MKSAILHLTVSGMCDGWRKIAISLIDLQKGEIKAQACVNAWFRQLSNAFRRIILCLVTRAATRLLVGVVRVSALFLLILGTASAQGQELAEPHKKWLLCDVDWMFTEETVGPSFSLKTSFHGTPVARARITLNKDGKVAATATTNKKGVAHFVSVPRGKYDPESPDGLLFPSGRLVIEVKPKHASGERVSLDWPNSSRAYRLLRGRFTTSEDVNDHEIPMRNILVELRDVYTARLIESGYTDANGDYQFSTNDPGLYALRLVLPKKGQSGFENRDLAVELNPSAKEYSMPEMKVVQSDCYGVQLLRRSSTDDLWEAQ